MRWPLIRRASRRDLQDEDAPVRGPDEPQPTGRRRWDPNLERCRADNKYTRTNEDGTKTVLSRGRFVSCNKQVKSTKRYREAGGFQDETFDMVVSPTWVSKGDRPGKMSPVALSKLLPKRKKAPAPVVQPDLPFDAEPRRLPAPPPQERRPPLAAGGSVPLGGGTMERERERQRQAALQATRPKARGEKKRRGRKKDPQPAPLAPPGTSRRPGKRGGRNLAEGAPLQVDVRTLLLSDPVYAPATFVRQGQANSVVVHADDPRVARSPATKALGGGLYAVDPTFIK